MNELIESGLNHNLVNNINLQQQITYYKRVDYFFFKSYEQFKLINDLLSLYCIAKVIIAIILIIIHIAIHNHKAQILTLIWILALIPISLLQLFYYRLMSKEMSKLTSFIKIAQKLNHCQEVSALDLGQNQIPQNIQTSVNRDIYDFNNLESEERQSKKINILAMQIKYESQKLTKTLLLVARLSFAFYQMLHFFGVYIYFSHVQTNLFNQFLIVILIIGTYQYLQIYVITITACFVIPIYGLIQLIKACVHKINSKKFIRMLKPQQFTPELIKGQHQCRVCMMNYNNGENIIILPCNELHHFHSLCIKSWLKLSLTCPLCREQFSNVQPQQLEQFLEEIN